jgi:hypothetical protein
VGRDEVRQGCSFSFSLFTFYFFRATKARKPLAKKGGIQFRGSDDLDMIFCAKVDAGHFFHSA